MHILDEKFRKELVDKHIGRAATVVRSPKGRFHDVIRYLAEVDAPVDKVRELIDALADWTHNPTESELRKILDVEEKVSGCGMTPDAEEAIAVIAYCITNGIPSNVDVVDIGDTPIYKVSFENITVSQRDAIMKASCLKNEMTPDNHCTGHWIKHTRLDRFGFRDDQSIVFYCDCCKGHADQPFAFCPHCHAKMENGSKVIE